MYIGEMPTKNRFVKDLKMNRIVIGFVASFCKKAEILYGRSQMIRASIKQEISPKKLYTSILSDLPTKPETEL